VSAQDADETVMGGMRAVLASLGASISLVAGAALSLLAVSLFFTYDDLTDAAGAPPSHRALVLESPATPASDRRAAASRSSAPLVVRVSRPPAAPRPRAATAARTPARRSLAQPASPARRSLPAAPAANDPAPAATPKPAAPAPAPGPAARERVRDLGSAVGATVQQAGDAAGAVAAPLGPPVSKAVQVVLDVLTTVVQRTAGALAGLRH